MPLKLIKRINYLLLLTKNLMKIYFDIEDNGPGIPDNIEVKKAKSLGLRLINI